MFLHDIGYKKFNIGHGDTLIGPLNWDDEPLEAIVPNPPYSIKWEGEDNPILINDERFPQHVCLGQSRRLILHLLCTRYHDLRQMV